ncbi:hypothetical protein B0H19DRAFT_924925 [Mycena capillaripes]|nr:hypothetical protein B0H19DRAFT_924925 [Mycena capillaripes]
MQSTDDANLTEILLVRSSEYWFEDGNIVLQVNSTQFRLTKSMLAMHSSVFRDMFTMPLPANESTVENCPVVVLTGDSPHDWTLFLGVMYPNYRSLVNEAPRMELIAAILRLSRKYDFAMFRKDCIRRLKKEFPTTLKEYDDPHDDWKLIQYEHGILLSIISLAREIGLLSILPLACCLMVTINNKIYLTRILNPEDASLNDSDRLVCLRGFANLLQLQSETTLAWLNVDAPQPHIPSLACRQNVTCIAAVKNIAFTMSRRNSPEICVIHRWNNNWGAGMCRSCGDKATEIYEAGRKVCWEKLPGAFGLPGWAELESLDIE